MTINATLSHHHRAGVADGLDAVSDFEPREVLLGVGKQNRQGHLLKGIQFLGVLDRKGKIAIKFGTEFRIHRLERLAKLDRHGRGERKTLRVLEKIQLKPTPAGLDARDDCL